MIVKFMTFKSLSPLHHFGKKVKWQSFPIKSNLINADVKEHVAVFVGTILSHVLCFVTCVYHFKFSRQDSSCILLQQLLLRNGWIIRIVASFHPLLQEISSTVCPF